MTAQQPSPPPANLSTDLTGRTIGRYYVRSLLGVGGQGEVYCAEDLKLNRTVALKRLSPALRADERYRQRFLREAQRASGLNDAHIAGIYDVLEHEGELLLVMEYVQGVSLRQQLREPLAVPEFLKVATQACEALIAAHESGVVHRDIKPENIMLTRTGRLKVLDFGVAKRLPAEDGSVALQSTETRAGEISGTPAYMAPELLLHQESDERTDIFSLGVVFYELLTGRHPFLVQGSLVATVDRLLHENPRSICDQNRAVPAALERIVFKMLAKDPGDRYSSANGLLADLSTIPSTPDGRVQALFWRLRRHRTAVAVGLGVLAAALVFGAIQFWPPKKVFFAERDWVLITDPENTTGQPIFNDSLREALTIALQQSQYVNVFPRQRIFEALERMKRSGVDRIDENLGRELCQRENIRVLLASSIRSSGEALQITVRALRPDSGDLLFAESVQLKRKEEFFEQVDSLAKRVRNDLGESTPRVEASTKSLEKVTTGSLEALQLYSQATNAFAKGDMERVPGLLQSALQLDHDFAMAHARLAGYYSWIGTRNEQALMEMKRAYDLRQGVTVREQKWIEGTYFGMQERYEDAVRAFASLVNLYPDDAEAHQQLAIAYEQVSQFGTAMTEMRRAVTLNPYSTAGYAKLALYAARVNAPEEAMRIYREASAHGVDSPALHWALGLAFMGEGKSNQARDEFRRLQGPHKNLGQLYLSRLDIYEGKLAAAARQLESDAQHDRTLQAGSLELVRRHLLGSTYLLMGRTERALRQAETVLAATPASIQTIDLLSAGSLYAKAGYGGKAREIVRRLESRRKTQATSWNKISIELLKGEIALSEKNSKLALASFSKALAEDPEEFLCYLGRARAYQASGNWAQAAQEWEKVLGARGRILESDFPPNLVIANLELGRLYVEMGELDRGRSHYQQFLRLWEHADDLPLRRQALKEFRSINQESKNPGQL